MARPRPAARARRAGEAGARPGGARRTVTAPPRIAHAECTARPRRRRGIRRPDPGNTQFPPRNSRNSSRSGGRKWLMGGECRDSVVVYPEIEETKGIGRAGMVRRRACARARPNFPPLETTTTPPPPGGAPPRPAPRRPAGSARVSCAGRSPAASPPIPAPHSPRARSPGPWASPPARPATPWPPSPAGARPSGCPAARSATAPRRTPPALPPPRPPRPRPARPAPAAPPRPRPPGPARARRRPGRGPARR